MRNLSILSHYKKTIYGAILGMVLQNCDNNQSNFTTKPISPSLSVAQSPTPKELPTENTHVNSKNTPTPTPISSLSPMPTVEITATAATPTPEPTVVVTAKVIGVNSTYIGFGGATGSKTNEHWIQDFSWTSKYDSIGYSSFFENLQLVGNALQIGNKLQLTTATRNQSGNAFYKNPIAFITSNNELIDWSAYFVFTMGGGSRADGITFILQSKAVNAGGKGGGIAFSDIPNSVGVAYDTFKNSFDADNNHIELDANGDVETPLSLTPSSILDLCGATGTDALRYNWIDYTSGTLRVYISDTNDKPQTPVLAFDIDLRKYLIHPY